jgi:ABC-2 type transport system permease protein
MKRTPTISLVVRREIDERLRGRLVWIMTVVMALSVVALIVIPALVKGRAEPTSIGLVGPTAQALQPALEDAAATAQVEIEVVDITDDATARSDIEDGTLGVALEIDGGSAAAVVKRELSPTIEALLRSVLNEENTRQLLTSAGVSSSTIQQAMTPIPFSTVAISPPPEDRAARSIAAIAAGLLLYMSLVLYGTIVANGVAQEKTSRTAEVLLGAVQPRQLMTGKVAGVGLVGLGQLAIAVGAGLIANAAVKGAQIPSTVWRLLPSILLWFLLGYTLYSFAYAAAGAIVARQEEVQFATLPIIIVLVAGFLITYAAIASPSAWWLRVLSFIPPFTPILMTVRIALGHVPAWDIVLGIMVMLVSIYATVHVAARIYSAFLVRGGARPSWRAALRLHEE